MLESVRTLAVRFAKDSGGQFAVWTALIAVPLILTSGGMLDIIGAQDARADLQLAADAGALAGARQLHLQPMAAATAEAKGEASFISNAFDSASISPTGEATVDTTQGTVTLVARGEFKTTFLGMIGVQTVPISAKAVAGAGKSSSGGGCVISLSSTASKALLTSGGSGISAPSCYVWVNSTAIDAVVNSGNGKIVAYQNCIEGTVSQGLAGFTPAPKSCGQFVDPWSTKVVAAPATCDHTGYSKSGTVNMSPGLYCGDVSLSGGPTVSLAPGVYYLKDSKFTMSGGGTMTGTGVTFVLIGKTTVTLSGSGVYKLTAPTSGPTAGFIFFQHANANQGAKATISGGGQSYYEGVIYFPTQNLLVSGGGATTLKSPFTVYLGNTITYTGGSQLYAALEPSKSKVPVPGGLVTSDSAPRLLQ